MFQYDEQGTLLPIRTCSLYAWCLMTNHFHLLIRERDWKISEVIKSLASSYVFYYNKKNERIGHLFQERFKSEPCNDMEYFVTLLRYIHQNRRTKQEQSPSSLGLCLARRRKTIVNPVKAGIADNAADYEWSSWKQDYLRDEGASVRQIVSHTGFTTKQVRNLTDKDKKKQAD